MPSPWTGWVFTSVVKPILGRPPSGKTVWYWVSGLALGSIFWVKEVVLPASLIFLAYPLVFRRWNWQWLYLVAGALIVFLANFLFFYIITGDLLYIVDIFTLRPNRGADVAISMQKEYGIGFYLFYLFVDFKHTFLLGFVAVLGASFVILKAVRRDAEIQAEPNAIAMVLVWGIGLWAFLTFFVTSIDPLRLIPKQANYMLIFAAPFAILGGYFLSQINFRIAVLLIMLHVVGGTILSGLSQLAVQNFTANSKSTLEFASAHPDAIMYVGSNALMVANYYNMLERSDDQQIADLRSWSEADCTDSDASAVPRFFVVDGETRMWGQSSLILPSVESRLAACLKNPQTLTPVGYGVGRNIGLFLIRMFGQLPVIGSSIRAKLESYVSPQPAIAYQIQ